MKKIMLSAAILAFAGLSVAQANPFQPSIIQGIVQDERTPVKPEDLPDAVKTTLSGEVYAGWAVKEAYAVAPTQGTPYFEVTLEKEGETQMVQLDAEGNIVTPESTMPAPQPSQSPQTPGMPQA